jgi:hypothetical protein
VGGALMPAMSSPVPGFCRLEDDVSQPLPVDFKVVVQAAQPCRLTPFHQPVDGVETDGEVDSVQCCCRV